MTILNFYVSVGNQHQASHAGATSSFLTDPSSHPQELPGMAHKLTLAWVHYQNCLKRDALETSCVFSGVSCPGMRVLLICSSLNQELCQDPPTAVNYTCYVLT